jgi:uncharacterized protein
VILRTAAISAALALALAPAAAAHVTVNPREWEAGGFARFAVRVPNERDDADTVRVQMQFPDEVLSASFQPVEGWKRTVRMRQLDPPVERDGERIAEKIDTVTWSGNRIRPGEFQEFGISFQVPDEPGSALRLPAVQTYSDGERVRWIGPEDAEAPAPVVSVLEAAAPAPEPAPVATPVRASAEAEGGTDTLSIIALAVGAAGLLAGVLALLRGRRSGDA